MANTFLALPAPGGSVGPGAAVDVSAMGATKTITVVADSNTVTTVETSNQAGPGPTNWSPVLTFDGSGEITVDVACRFMRINVQELGASDPVANVGGTTDGTTLVALDTPAGNGPGASVDVSAVPGFKTLQICGSFGGAVNLEISLDNGTTWQTVASFSGGGGTQQVSLTKFAQFMRVNRNGVLAGDVSQPAVIVGGAATGGGGSGGGGGGGIVATMLALQEPEQFGIDAGQNNWQWSTSDPLTFPVGQRIVMQATLSYSGETDLPDGSIQANCFIVQDPGGKGGVNLGNANQWQGGWADGTSFALSLASQATFVSDGNPHVYAIVSSINPFGGGGAVITALNLIGAQLTIWAVE